MKPILILLLTISLLFQIAFSQDLNEKVKGEVERGDLNAAIDSLQQLKEADQKAFTSADYDYLLARVAEDNGSLALAVANYQAIANRGSVLRPFAFRRLARIARSTGNLLLERHYLRQLELYDPDSPVAKCALIRSAENALDAGNYAATIATLNEGFNSQPVKTKTSDSIDLRDVRALLADAYHRGGDGQRARSLYEDLISSDADLSRPDDASIKAVKGLDQLDGGIEDLGKSVPALSESEHFKRANIYQFNREFDAARRHYQSIIDDHNSGANIPEAVFQIGRGYVQQANFVEAVHWFEHIREQYPQSVTAKDALLQSASAYGRLGKTRESVARYQQYIDKYPGDDKLDRAYLNIVDVLRDQGEEAEALRWCAKTRDELKGTPAESVAAASEARLYIARESWPDALIALEQLRTLPNTRTLPGGSTADEVSFSRAFVLEQLKRFPEAVDAYLSIPDGRDHYYGWLATLRLRKLANDDAARSFVDQRLGTASAGLSANEPDQKRSNALTVLRLTSQRDIRQRAVEVLRSLTPKTLTKIELVPLDELIDKDKAPPKRSKGKATAVEKLVTMGLYDDAVILLGQTDEDNERYTLATFYKKGDRGDLSMAFIEPILRSMPADHPADLIERDQLELLYPAPYKQHVVRYAGEYGVDPRLLLAIMRQESRFDPNARSNAAARGLMQFTLPTASRISGRVKRDAFEQDDLYDPATSIQFGSRYVADLFLEFPNQAEAVAASYNGGEDNMRRWLNRSRSELPDRYVSEIAYAQSKDYVQNVLNNYRMYKYLYDEQLRRV